MTTETNRTQRLEDALITLAAVLDAELAKRSPYYPASLNNPELGLRIGDLDGLWYGSWKATYAARKHDPRYVGDKAKKGQQ